MRPELVGEVKYLTWTDDNLLRQVVYEGLREDKPAAEVRRSAPHPKSGAQNRTVTAKNQSIAAGASPLSHSQLVALDLETRARRRPGVGIVHRRRARLHNERPQFSKVLTPIVKIGEAIPPQEGFAGPVPFASHGAAKGRPQPGIVLAILMAANAPAPLVGNGIGQIPLGRVAFDRVMAADEIERADKTTVTAAIAKAAFYPMLAITEELRRLRIFGQRDKLKADRPKGRETWASRGNSTARNLRREWRWRRFRGRRPWRSCRRSLGFIRR